MGMYCCTDGTGSDNVGCVQGGGGAAAARDPELSRSAGAARGGHCGLTGAGAAIRLEALACPTRCWLGPCTARWPQYALSNQRRGDPAASRVDGNVRALLASSIKPRKGTRRTEKQSVKRGGT